jgi:creatinine amidohydrolase
MTGVCSLPITRPSRFTSSNRVILTDAQASRFFICQDARCCTVAPRCCRSHNAFIMAHTARDFVVHEATLKQLQALKPNVAVLPWGATEAHNFHLPHGTDNIEATSVGERAVERANAAGARVVLLPTVPFGNDNMQLRGQVATITMRTATQLALLTDVALSLVAQGIDRLVVLNFHGGNDFKQLIRDVMFEVPIFIVQVNAFVVAPHDDLVTITDGDHANEFETSLMLHLAPELVDMPSAADGSYQPFKLKSLRAPGVWCPRDWQALSASTGTGDPRNADAARGKAIFERLADAVVPVLTELSAAQNGDFPYVVHPPKP